jgi:hypothetical protein
MTTKPFLSTILVFTLFACNNNKSDGKPKDEIPKALGDKSSLSEVVPRYAQKDMVESLFNELVSKDANLQKLEAMIDELNSSKDDSTESFNKFDQKNKDYVNSSNRHLLTIKDSVLKNKIKDLVSNQLTKYSSQIVRHDELLKIIESKQTTISDLHTALMLVKTLPLIEKYQRENLPEKEPLEGYIKRQQEAIQKADTLLNN